MIRISAILLILIACSSNDNEAGSGNINPCENTAIGEGTVTCSGQTYNTVAIGTQIWMSENLNYAVDGSKCGNDSTCDAYGRLYNWAAAMALPSSCNSNSCASQIQYPYHRGICPEGWHIPSDADWDTLLYYVDEINGTVNVFNTISPYSSNTAGKYLKEADGFSATLGGYGYGNSFYGTGSAGLWWSAGEGNDTYAFGRGVLNDVDNFRSSYGYKTYFFSVRCLQD